MIRVLFVCHGNICRSTMAESIFNHMIREKGIDGLFEVDSAGTSREEIGHSVHRGTVKKLTEEGIPITPHSARQMTWVDYEYNDYLIGMDSANIHNMLRIAGGEDSEGKIYKIMQFVGEDRDVSDPWYSGDFDATYRDMVKGLNGFMDFLEQEGKL